MSDETDAEVARRFADARTQGLSVIEAAHDLGELGEARVQALGRKSALSNARSGLRSAPEEKRRSLGQLANAVQIELEAALAA